MSEVAEEFSGGGVDDADVEVVDEEDDVGSGVGSSDADVVELAVDAQGDDAAGTAWASHPATPRPSRNAGCWCLLVVRRRSPCRRAVRVRRFVRAGPGCRERRLPAVRTRGVRQSRWRVG